MAIRPIKKDICDDASEIALPLIRNRFIFLINLKSQTEPIYFFSLYPKLIELSIIYRENRRKKVCSGVSIFGEASL
jgi:hypothetical protein